MYFNLAFEFNKLHLKEIVILMPRYHPNMTSFLTPILGLYGINIKEFITSFEEKVKFINFDVVVPTRVKISKIKTFEIFLKTPYITSIISNVTDFSLIKNDISVLCLYKISLIKSILVSSTVSLINQRVYLSVKKYLHLIFKTSRFSSVDYHYLNYHKSINLELVRNNLKVLNYLTNLKACPFGIFVSFVNFNNIYINGLKAVMELFSGIAKKVKPRFLSSLSAKKISGDVFFFGNKDFSGIYNFFVELMRKKSFSSFFVSYFKINSNLMHYSFLNALLKQFELFKKINFLFFVRNFILKFIRLVSLGQINFLLVLSRSANLSSNII